MTVIFWQIEDASVDTQHGMMLITNLFFWIVYTKMHERRTVVRSASHNHHWNKTMITKYLLCAIYCCNVNPILRKYKYSLRKGCRAKIPHLFMWNGVNSIWLISHRHQGETHRKQKY